MAVNYEIILRVGVAYHNEYYKVTTPGNVKSYDDSTKQNIWCVTSWDNVGTYKYLFHIIYIFKISLDRSQYIKNKNEAEIHEMSKRRRFGGII